MKAMMKVMAFFARNLAAHRQLSAKHIGYCNKILLG